jgi:hypothetical protein
MFWSGNKLLEECSKPNLADDDSSEDDEYSVEMDDKYPIDEYMSD